MFDVKYAGLRTYRSIKRYSVLWMLESCHLLNDVCQLQYKRSSPWQHTYLPTTYPQKLRIVDMLRWCLHKGRHAHLYADQLAEVGA